MGDRATEPARRIYPRIEGKDYEFTDSLDGWNVRNLTDNVTYQIYQGYGGVMQCTCEAWQFSKGVKTCKHIRALAELDKPTPLLEGMG